MAVKRVCVCVSVVRNTYPMTLKIIYCANWWQPRSMTYALSLSCACIQSEREFIMCRIPAQQSVLQLVAKISWKCMSVQFLYFCLCEI